MTNDSVSMRPVPSREDILCGPGVTKSSPVPLRAGALELRFEPETGWIRQIRLGDRELVRAIYGAVRDRDWRTVPPVLRVLSIQQAGDDGFEICFTAECRVQDIHFVWQGLISGTRESIQFGFDGRAHSNFLRNRIGLCVLLPIAECAGQPCLVEHSDGAEVQATIPEYIFPHQPFQDIRVIRTKATNDGMLEVRFTGDIFEMEDQRNWTDASFKIYSTPLARPFPAQVNAGDLVRQSVALRLLCAPGTEPMSFAGSASDSAESDPVTVEVNFERLRPKPPIGLGLASEQWLLHSNTGHRLRDLKLGHLRVDCRLWEPDWPGRLKLAEEQAKAIGSRLHVSCYLSNNAEAELHELGGTAARLNAPVSLWLVFHRDSKCTPAGWIKRAREILTPVCPQAHFAAGTDAYFAELNRERPPVDADWLPCCSINPQVHASDNLSLIENLAAQIDVVKTSRSFSAQPLVISPITLLPRSNPNATGATLCGSDSPADPRQSSLFAAGWTLGSLAALTATHPVHSLTYYETFGPRGIIDTGDAAEVFPVYHVFAGVSEFTRLAETRFSNGRTSLQLAALAGVSKAGRSVLWLANLTEESVRVRLRAIPHFRSVLIKTLDETNAAEAMRQPEEWWLKASAVSNRNLALAVKMPRYGLARLEMMT